ncbi:MAG: transcription antiterminator [Acidimicrobiales bacterium]|nr:transcription antiterminator [Acidimicrobiales bacterium]
MTRWLIDQDRPRSTAEMASDLGLSERVIRYRLATAEKFLEAEGASLTRRRGLGLVVTADDDTRQRIRENLADRMEAPRVYTPAEREYLLVAALLWAAPKIVSLDELNLQLEVSKTSARRDLHRCEPWLERNGLPLVRKPGKGIVVTGSERQIRRATVQLFLEAVPRDALEELTNFQFSDAQLIRTRVPEGLRERLASLPLRECSQALRSVELRDGALDGNAEMVFALYLAVSAVRSQAGREISLDAGQQVSLMDHPASETVRRLMEVLATRGVELPAEEMAGITEYLLGLDALSLVKHEPLGISVVLDRFLDEAGQRLHPSLADDAELRTNLALHLGRLGVRLRHGLPIHNPLLAEVIARYPDVYAVTGQLAAKVGEHFGSALNDDEVGFLTMYLSGAMERSHLRPRKRALVVCPSGMATVWVLVSRIQAEFPELALVQVLSASNYAEVDDTEFDLVISTIPLPTRGVPVLVVSPLLSAADVRRVNALLLEPTETET